MAKQLKIIKCPQCGSIKNTEIKPDYYKCDSCGAEYFLDNDDININIKHDSSPTNYTKSETHQPNLKAVFTVMIIVFALGFTIVKKFFYKTDSSGYESFSSIGHDNKEEWNEVKEYFYDASDKTPILIRIGNLGSGERAKPNIVSYNVSNGKEIARSEIGNITSISDLDYRIFDNGQPYIIINKAQLFAIDKTTKTLKAISVQSMGSQPLLQSGIAKLEFVYDNYGSGFNIMTNEGRQVYYYPIIDQLYDGNDAFMKARDQDNPNSVVKLDFKFSFKSTNYPNEKVQLIKYTYKYNSGYPRDDPAFEWRKDFGGSGIFTDADPYKKVLINNYSIKKYKVINYTDFTPNRLYFDPKVLASNEKSILVYFKATPTDDAQTSLQLLDAQTAKVLWTLSIASKGTTSNTINDGYISSTGYFVNGNAMDMFIGFDGKILQKFQAP